MSLAKSILAGVVLSIALVGPGAAAEVNSAQTRQGSMLRMP